MIMDNRSVVRVGFLDMLTGFLIATVILMLIFSYSLDKSGDVAAGPKDYLFYQLKIDSKIDEQIQLKFFIRPSGSRKWLEAVNNKRTGEIVSQDELFKKLSGKRKMVDEVFFWGPVFEYNQDGSLNTSTVVYNIYGVGTLDSKSNWEIGVLYFNNKSLDADFYDNMTANEIQRITSKNIELKHFGNTRMIDTPISTTDYISLGEYSTFSIPSKH